jgi:hypothetical protein
VDTLALIDELESLVEGGGSLLVSSQVRVEREDLLSLLGELRSTYRAELDEARALTAEPGDPLAEARRECELLLRAAREQAELEIADSRIERIADRRAGEVLHRARRHAFEIGHETDRWVDEILGTLEPNLDKFIGAVRHGRVRLHERSSKESVRAAHGIEPPGQVAA